MSFFSSPAAVGTPQRDAIDKANEDPNIKAQRDAAAAAANAERDKVATNARQRYQGRTMGTEGANALFTGSPAGYGRTMGSANI